MTEIPNYSDLNSLVYKDSNGSELTAKVEVKLDKKSNTLHIKSIDDKTSSVFMEINLGTNNKEPKHKKLCNYSINYMSCSADLNGCEFGKLAIIENPNEGITLKSSHRTFLLKNSPS